MNRAKSFSRGQPFNRGQWQVHRERLQVADAAPDPAFTEPRTLGDLLPAVMKRLGLEQEQWLGTLEREWLTLVGPAVAKHTRPGRFERKLLTVFVDSSVWRNELERFGKVEMLRKLQAKFGKDKIEAVSLQMAPDGM